MEHINLLFAAVGFFLSASHLFVQTLPIKYHEKNLTVNATPIQKDALTNFSNNPLGSWGLPAPNNDTVGLVMFPMLADVGNKVQYPTNPNKPGDRSSNNSNTATTTTQTEMTVAMRNYKTDSLGYPRFAKVPQDDTDGDVGIKQDTRTVHPLRSWELPAPINDTVGLVMFPMLADVRNNVQHPTNPNEPGDRSSDNSNTATTKRQTEMTVAIRNYKTDSLGYSRFAKVPQDESVGDVVLKQYMRGIPRGRPRAPVAQGRAYNIPDSTKFPVCFGSTIYNFPKQIRYLRPRLYNRRYFVRPVWLDLRQEIYNDAKSQECHVWNLTNWDQYIYCAIMRNMRMEYLVPKYPLHQQGGYFYLRSYIYKFPDEY